MKLKLKIKLKIKVGKVLANMPPINVAAENSAEFASKRSL